MPGDHLQLSDVLDARQAIAPYLGQTPLYRYPLLDELVGAEVHVKHENHLPTGAFKVRGGVNLLARVAPQSPTAGVYTASTGNHGQSIAYAASLFGVAATVYVPRAANPVKTAAIRALGARLIEYGADFDEARERCAIDAAAAGGRYVHSANEPLLIAGVATIALEILEQQADLDAIIVPLGGGSGAAGACIAVKALSPHTEVIAVQAAAAPAACRAWRERRLVEDQMRTFAEGLATRVAFELPQRILWEHLDDCVLVEENELRSATLAMLERTRNLVEAAGAASLAGALRLRERLAGKRVALVLSGGNISPAQLSQLLAWGEQHNS
jgi:threonine dehydratase